MFFQENEVTAELSWGARSGAVSAGYWRRPGSSGRPAGSGVPLSRAEPGAYRLRWAISLSESQLAGLFAVADDGALKLTREARSTIGTMFQSRYIGWLGYQQSWALIGRIGFPPFAEQASSDWMVLAYTILRFPLPPRY
jgi:hypothetical protein